MQRIILWIAAFVVIVSAGSCKKEMMNYEGSEGVYFAVQRASTSTGSDANGPYFNFTNLEFSKVKPDETTVNIKVAITGPLKAYDRPFRVEVNPDSTTARLGVHYKAVAPEVIIPANQTFAYVPVNLLRTPEMKTQIITLGLKLVPNQHFQLSFPEFDAIPGRTSFEGAVLQEFDASLHTIRINDFIVKPAIWPGSLTAANVETGSWGVFTEKKIRLMFQLMNLTYSDFASTETMPLVLQLVIASQCANYLIERFNAKDPVLEDDGRLMFIGAVPWTSKPGVKWVP
jgi:hypothetical protein